MKRLHQKHLRNWFYRTNRMPMILRGARQVGKSTLVRLFCEEEKLDLVEVNLERGKLKSVEKENVTLDEVLDEVQLRAKKKLNERSIVFFDEIQEQPKLIQFLRYFYEEKPQLAVISAGSLLEMALKTESFSFPVGRVEFQHLGPMTFLEFLLANDHHLVVEKILAHDFSPTLSSFAAEEFRKYLYIGGMPHAVKTYVEEKSMSRVREIQEQILQTYMADFPKYNAKIRFDRIQRIFAATATQLGKKLIFQRLDRESQSRDIRRVIELLIDARVLIMCHHCDANLVPLRGEMDPSIQKLFFLDVGLVNCMMKTDLDVIDKEMKNQFSTKGMIAEQFVAQHLAYLNHFATGPELYYWLRDKGTQKGEIDFVIEKGQDVLPVEVKSKSSGHLKSLFYFLEEKKKEKAIKLSLEEFARERIQHKIDGKLVQGELLTIPIWAVETIYQLVTP
jgi:predicted AAA+ superfamily ATPase